MAWAARALTYGEKIAYKNPKFLSATATAHTKREGIAGKLLLKFDTAVEVRSGHVGRFDATIQAYSKAWLTVNGVNATLAGTPEGDVEVIVPSKTDTSWCDEAHVVTGSSSLSLEYLQGDWPVPAIYAKASGVPGLPATPFIATTTVICN